MRLRALAAAGLLAGAAHAAAAGGAFRFVALGDMPYGADSRTGPAYRHLIDQINGERPAFSIHVGDLKDGVTACTDALFERQRDHFQRFERALFFTPGDNDWSDCTRTGEDPLERLQALRRIFFGRAQSLGREPLAVERQADRMPTFAAYPENQRWWHQGVLFTTFHAIGPDNNARASSAALRAEYLSRESANAAWIRASFALARERGARALVFATQADMLKVVDTRRPARLRNGFQTSIGATLLPLAAASRLPVLLVHGDSHDYITDQPFVDGRGRRIPNLWRLEVFGEPRMHAVRVQVDPAGRVPFRFAPIWNAQSADPRR